MARQIKNPHHPAERTGPRILLIRLSAVGDVIHAMPCVTALRRALPDAHIAWVVEPGPAQLLTRHPDLDEVISMPRRHWRKMRWLRSFGERHAWARHLRERRFDVAIDLQGLWKSARVAWLSGARTRYTFGDEQAREFSWLGVPPENCITPPPEARHVVERYLSLVSALLGREWGIGNRVSGIGDRATGNDPLSPIPYPLSPPLWRFGPLDEEAREWVMEWWPLLPGFADQPWVALNPGAGWETKRWPVGHFAQLAERIEGALGASALFLWGPGDEPLREELMRRHGGERFAHAPPNDLMQLRALLMGCAAFVGGDTGPTHLAAALGVPCVSPHGGSDPVRNGPHGPSHISLAVSQEEVPCVPCWRTTCNYREPLACLRELAVERVLGAVATQLERHPERNVCAERLLHEALKAA